MGKWIRGTPFQEGWYFIFDYDPTDAVVLLSYFDGTAFYMPYECMRQPWEVRYYQEIEFPEAPSDD